jgi:hypothetical protein
MHKLAAKFPDSAHQSRVNRGFFAKFHEIAPIFSTLGLRQPPALSFNPPPHYG